eukprot:scaffold3437_cov113-Cylindrotheca_fusiformis.AAC.27
MEHFKRSHKLECKKLAASSKAPTPTSPTPTPAPAPPTPPPATTVEMENGKQHDGIQVVDTNSPLGRVVLATKDFKAGEIVLCEAPAIVFEDQTGYTALWDAYQNASPQTQKEILEMQADSVLGEKEIMERIQTDLLLMKKKRNEEIDPTLARTLVEIALINAHAYQPEGTTTEGYDSELSKAALFTMGSKVEHSCAPNISFETSSKGLLEYVTQVPIFKNERLSISYQSHVYEESRSQRRQNIHESKGFLCECSRCLNYDECNPLDCHHCNVKGTLFQLGADLSWKCQACDWKGDTSSEDTIEKQMKAQEELSQKLDAIKLRLESTGFHPAMVMECCIIQNIIASKFSALHWLHPKAYHSLRVVATSQARFLMKKKGLPKSDPSVIAMLQLAGKSQLEHFRWLSRNISLVHGTCKLPDVCTKVVDNVESLQERKLRSKKDMEPYLDAVISTAESSFNINTQTVSLIFHGGLDLLLAGHTERVAKLFTSFKEMLSQWKILSKENRKRIQILTKSKGKRNPFPNHIVAN